jgi:hypothetical protein
LGVLRAGETTREDVLMRYGEPDAVVNDESVVIYDWAVVAGSAFGFGFGVDIPKHYSVVIEFAPDGKMMTYKRIEELYVSQESAIAKFYSLYYSGTTRRVLVVDPLPNVWTNMGSSAPRLHTRSISVSKFHDARSQPYADTLIGQHWNAHLLKETEIRSYHPVSEVLRACVVKHLEKSGFVVTNGDSELELEGTVTAFKAEGTAVDSDITIEVHSSASRKSIVRRYQSTTRDWGSRFSLDESMRVSLEGLQEQLASDLELKRFLVGR